MPTFRKIGHNFIYYAAQNHLKWTVILCLVLFIFNIKNLNRYYKNFVLENAVIVENLKRAKDLHKFYTSGNYLSPDAYIAHGGGIGKFTYTNSLEAVLDSLRKGFRFIEIDMLETSDGHILGAHDWKTFKSLTGIKDNSDSPLSFSEIQELRTDNKYTVLSGNSISNLMKLNQEYVLVTDKIKNYNLLLKEIPYPDRIIVEVFKPKDYLKALYSGIRYPAYCIWDKKNLKTAVKLKFPIVTLNAKNFFENDAAIELVQKLHDSGVTILLFYTSFLNRDKPEFLKKHLGKTVSKIYTDTWSPTTLP